MTAAAPKGGTAVWGWNLFGTGNEKRPWHGLLGPAAGAAALGLLLTMALTGDRARAAAATAALELSRPEAVAAAAQAELGDTVIPLGRAVGIKLFSDGVLVVGLSSLDTLRPGVPLGTMGLKAGDVITHMDGSEVDTIEEVQDHLAQHPGEKMTLQVQRGGVLQLAAQAVKTTTGSYQLGVWLRDSMAGIGTMTFYDPDSGVFAALGHGINDVDTAKLMPLETGSIMGATVSDVKKGAAGEPGELHGDFDLTADLGTLYANTEQGIFGRLEDAALAQDLQPVEVAGRDQVQTGRATILSNIAGDTVEEYEVEITHLYPENAGDSRNLMLRVTDQRLLEATGGIVQGMP